MQSHALLRTCACIHHLRPLANLNTRLTLGLQYIDLPNYALFITVPYSSLQAGPLAGESCPWWLFHTFSAKFWFHVSIQTRAEEWSAYQLGSRARCFWNCTLAQRAEISWDVDHSNSIQMCRTAVSEDSHNNILWSLEFSEKSQILPDQTSNFSNWQNVPWICLVLNSTYCSFAEHHEFTNLAWGTGRTVSVDPKDCHTVINCQVGVRGWDVVMLVKMRWKCQEHLEILCNVKVLKK